MTNIIQVDNIHISVQGMTEAEAGVFGQQIAECMAARLPENGNPGVSHVGELNVQFRPTTGIGHTEMVDGIATKLLQQLNML